MIAEFRQGPAALAEKGERTLLVDLDPQGHSTIGFGFDPDEMDKTIYNTLTKSDIPISEVIVSTKVERLGLVPSNVLLSGAQ